MENAEVEVLETKPKKKVFKVFLLILWFLITMALAGLVVYLIWFKENYEVIEVTFDSSGGTEVRKQIVVKGEKATEPKVPVSEGYDFGGWYLDDKEFDFETIVEKDITLKAKWKIVEYEDSFYIQCYTKKSVEKNDLVIVENPAIGDEMVCYFSFETRAVDPVAKLSFDLNYGEGLELLDVESTEDFKVVSGKSFSYEFKKPSSTNEAGAYIFKVIDDEDVDIRFGNISFVTEEGIVYKSKNVRIAYEFGEEETEEVQEYKADSFSLQCYTKESVDANKFEKVSKVKTGDKIVCFVGYETYSTDKVNHVSYALDYGSGLKLLEKDLYSIGKEKNGVDVFDFSATSVNDISEYVFEVTDTSDVSKLYVGIKNIYFETAKGDKYTNIDNILEFEVE